MNRVSVSSDSEPVGTMSIGNRFPQSVTDGSGSGRVFTDQVAFIKSADVRTSADWHDLPAVRLPGDVQNIDALTRMRGARPLPT